MRRHEFQAGDLGDAAGVDETAIPQDRHAVADTKHLFEAMGDVDDGDAVATKQVDDLEQPLDLSRFEGRRRLVHDHDPVVRGDRAGDRDHLLDAQAELAKRSPDVDRQAVARQDRGASRCIRSKSIKPSRLVGSWPRNRLRATLSSGTRLTSW